MTTHQLIPAKPAGTAPPSFTPVRGGLLQRKCACGGTPGPTGECEGCRQKRNGIEGTFQRRAANTAESALAPPIVQEVMPSPGQQRDPAARDFIEPRFGHDFSRVRVHPDEKAATSAATVAKLIAGLEQLSGIDLSDVRVHFNSSEPAQLNA